MRTVNFGIEHQFTNTLKEGVQYIGQFGFGLFGERDINAPPLNADPDHPVSSSIAQRGQIHNLPPFAQTRTRAPRITTACL